MNGIRDYTNVIYKLKKAAKAKTKVFPSDEPTPKGVQAVEDIVGMNPSKEIIMMKQTEPMMNG